MENSVEITFKRAFKLLIGFGWRSLVLGLPVLILMAALSWTIMPFPTPGTPVEQLTPPPFGKLLLLWMVMTIVSLIAYTLALRWTLTTKFSDFKLVAVKPE